MMMLPKPYVSYSQVILWEKNPREYERLYMLGGVQEDSVQMAYGRKVDKAIEEERASDQVEEHLLIYLPKYEFRQKEMTATIKVDEHPIRVLGKFDGYTSGPMPVIGEHKTGVWPWTQKKADQSDQLTTYDLIHWISTGMQTELWIHWMPTEKVAGGVMATGEVINFKTKRRVADLLKMQGRIANAVRGISARYEEISNRVFR